MGNRTVNIRVTPQINTQRKQEDGTFAVRLDVRHNGRTRHPMGFSVPLTMWDAKRGRVKIAHKEQIALNAKIDTATKRLEQLAKEHPDATAGELCAMLTGSGGTGLIDAITHVEAKGTRFADGTRVILRGTIAKAAEILPRVKELKPSDVQHFREQLEKSGLDVNTVRLHMRMLRLMYNVVLEGRGQEPTRAFIKLIPAEQQTEAKYLPPEEVERLRSAPMPTERVALMRDTWILALCLGGMRIADVLTLKADQIQDGRLVYRQGKTKPLVRMPLIPPAAQIVDQYKGGKYVLPIFKGNVKSSTALVNEHLKIAAQAAGIDKPLSSHWARHSVTNWMLYLNVPIDVISMILGHKSIRQTIPYVSKFDDKRVDEAMEKLGKAMVRG